MKKISLFFMILYFPLVSFAQNSKQHLYYEKEYQKYWCNKNCGLSEIVLSDKTRVDCVTDKYAIEFDFAPKWAESIGQALYYGEVLKKDSGVVLIVENKEKDEKYVNRLNLMAQKYGITVWLMYPEDISQ